MGGGTLDLSSGTPPVMEYGSLNRINPVNERCCIVPGCFHLLFMPTWIWESDLILCVIFLTDRSFTLKYMPNFWKDKVFH